MSNVEIIIMVCACLIPIIALVIILPTMKFHKKTKQLELPKTETYKPSEPVVPVEEPKVTLKKRPVESKNYSTDDFKDYLKDKQSKSSIPTRNRLPNNYIDRTGKYLPMDEHMNKPTDDKTVAEQVQSLSPEVLALIVSGVLDKKF